MIYKRSSAQQRESGLSFFTLKNATTAYKKAKIDAWKLHSIDANAFMLFELKFKENLCDFLSAVAWSDYDTILTEKWLGSWCYRIKKIVPDITTSRGELYSAPEKNLRSSGVKQVDYRVFAKPTVNLHLLGALWIELVGTKYCACLDSCVYGNRLRPKPNPRHAGSFQSYLPLLKEWKHAAIKKIKQLLSSKKDVVVVTADVTAYYHSLKPDFLMNQEYLSKHNIRLTKEEEQLTQILIAAINYWADQTPLKTGLPVGLPVSAFIANLALADFDDIIKKLEPASYGRYVDDIIIVFERHKSFVDRESVWKYISASSNWLSLTFEGAEKDKPVLDFIPHYLDDITNSRISFNGEKCRIFFLDSKSGLGFIQRLENQIREASSEFRLLPEHIGNTTSVSHRLQRLITSEGELADGFRKIDSVTFRKVDFTGFMKEMEFFYKTLHPSIWVKQRNVFYKFFRENILTLKHYADYEANVFRVISLGVCCGDFNELIKICETIVRLVEDVKNVKIHKVAHPVQKPKNGANEEAFLIDSNSFEMRLRKPFYKNVVDVIQRSYNGYGNGNDEYKQSYERFRNNVNELMKVGLLPADKVSTYNLHAFVHDLSEFRYIENLYRKEVSSHYSVSSNMGARLHSIGITLDDEIRSLFDEVFLEGIDLFKRWVLPEYYTTSKVPYGLLFPTRPLLPKDLFWLKNHDILIKHCDIVTNSFRGYISKLYSKAQCGGVDIVSVEHAHILQPKVALVNMVTKKEEVATTLRSADKTITNSLKRLCDIISLVNNILRNEKDLTYLLFHELSMPAEWFLQIAERCAGSGVSVIAGIDYIITDEKSKYCVNPVWMSLVNERGTFRQQMYICEVKNEFADYEKAKVKQLGYENDPNLSMHHHAIIKHGAFCFSVLICSEITDIDNRSRLRGFIDALFVLAWNQDIHYFSSIIESATLDLNAYVVQCNNNDFGDSRVRVPARQQHERDLVRLRGGKSTYYVCAVLPIDKLRTFQEEFYRNEQQDNDAFFKPLPAGFRLKALRFPDSEFADQE